MPYIKNVDNYVDNYVDKMWITFTSNGGGLIQMALKPPLD